MVVPRRILTAYLSWVRKLKASLEADRMVALRPIPTARKL
jgi:hypothetical protein